MWIILKRLAAESGPQHRRCPFGRAERTWRVEAMRHVVKALALDSEDLKAQKLFVELLVDADGPAPVQAEQDYQAHVDSMRARGARMGALGFFAMLLAFPLALWIGVRSWPAIIALSVTGVACAGFAFWASHGRPRAAHANFLSLLTALLVALTSTIAGPIAVVPALAAGVLMFFVAHVTPAERRVAITLITLGAVLPYGIEAMGWFSPMYGFEPGEIVLYSHAIEFTKGPRWRPSCIPASLSWRYRRYSPAGYTTS